MVTRIIQGWEAGLVSKEEVAALLERLLAEVTAKLTETETEKAA